MTHILLGDDDKELTALLKEYLSNYDVICDCAYDGEQILNQLDAHPYDLLVLDIMMPKLDGLGVLRKLTDVSMLPVIMLTARGDEIDRIIGLELGADDYISKPCNPRELLARISAVIKRTSNQQTINVPIAHDRLYLDPVHRLCRIDDEEMHLTGTEFDLLLALLQKTGVVATKDWLSQTVLMRELQPFDNSLDVHISRLRKKLKQYHPKPIRAVRGRGYQLVI